MSHERTDRKSSLAELPGLAVAACALSLFQTRFPITIGPDWLLAGAFGIAPVAAYLQGYRGCLALAAGSAFAWLTFDSGGPAALAMLTSVVECLVLCEVLRHGPRLSAELESPRQVVHFAILIAIGALVRGLVVGLISPLVGADPPIAGLGALSVEWLAAVMIVPMSVLSLRGQVPNWRERGRFLEFLALIGIATGVTWIWFGGTQPRPMSHAIPMLSVLLGLGNWVSFRFYLRGTACLISTMGLVLIVGASQRGDFAPVFPIDAQPVEQALWLGGAGIVIVFQLVIASVAKDYALRERDRDKLMVAVQKHAERLGEVNARLSLQALEIADQAEELQRQRDEFERLAKELSDKQMRLGLLESAVVNAQDAIVVLEANPQPERGRRVLYVNDAFSRITGYPPEEVLGRSLHFLRGERTDSETLANMRIALDQRRPFNCELLNYRRNGESYWVSLSIVPVNDSTGDNTHFVMIQRDITDRKHAEDALRSSEAKFRGIFETASAGVSITDANGRFVSCNPAFAAMLGIRPEDVVGRFPREFTHPEDWEAQHDLNEALMRGDIDHYQIRKRYVRPDGSSTWTELSLSAMRGPEGQYESGLGISVDVSSRMNLEEQLRQVQKMEALGQLAGGIAHDFNNLLTAVLGNLSLVKLPDHDPHAHLLQTIEKAASRAADLTRKLLGYARRNQLNVTPMQPRMIIAEIVDILRRTIDPRIEIKTVISTDEPITVDATLMNQALMNLCLNARDAMPDGGRLTITADHRVINDTASDGSPDVRSGHFICISVSDTGTGMNDLVKQRLFEPFFTTKGVGRGTGLGLPMVHGIMKQHGGWVAFESELGHGTRFDIFLPSQRDPASPSLSRFGGPPQCDINTPPPVQPQSATILLVDDEEMIRVLGRTILESSGYRVIEAVDGQDAVEKYSVHGSEINVVILDLTMPRLSGRDAHNRIVAMNPSARIIFSSGYSTEDLSEIEGTLGMLSKPYRPNDLLAAIHRAMRNIPLSTPSADRDYSNGTLIST